MDDIDISQYFPLGLRHRNSEQDIIDYLEAADTGELRELYGRWVREDAVAAKKRRAAEQAKLERLKQDARDQQQAEIVSMLRKMSSDQSLSGKKFLSVKEVAQLLGKSEKTIRRWTEREAFPLPVIKKPNAKQDTWTFERQEVLNWFELYQQKSV